MQPDLSRLVEEVLIVGKLLPPHAFFAWGFNVFRCIPTLLKTRSLGILDRLFGDSFDIRWNQQQLHFDQLDFGVVREIYGHCCYIHPDELKNAKHILDLGANSGAFTVFAALAAPDAQIQAVEAQSELLQALEHNVTNNHCEDRVKTQCAVVGGAFNDWTKMILRERPQVEVFDIDHYIAQVGICDFLKCDVEGGEFPLFTGNLQWTQSVDRMALEFHPSEGNVDQLEQILNDQGFDVQRVDHSTLGYYYCKRK